MLRRVAAASALVLGLVVLGAIPAWAHVTVDPPSAPKGGSDIEIGFRVPNEEAKASTTKIAIELPSSPPILNVLAQSTPGWTAAVVTTTLPKPIQTDDGPVSDIVTQVTWTATNAAAGIKPGDFERFEILVGSLPDSGNQIVFKALQTYSDGTVVSWIDPVTAGGPEAEHPTPILALTSPTSEATTPAGSKAATGTPVATTGLAKKSQVDSARTAGIIGVVVGALGLLAGGAALASRRRSAEKRRRSPRQHRERYVQSASRSISTRRPASTAAPAMVSCREVLTVSKHALTPFERKRLGWLIA